MSFEDRVVEAVRSTVDSGAPGVAVGVYSDGRLIHHASAGLANVEFAAPVGIDTRFDIASMSKQFTATAALLLCRDGVLSLQDDIRTYLPELRLSQPVTIAQALRHTGGLPEWLALSAMAGRPLTRITQDQVLAFVAGLAELNFTPGTDFSYSNTGYVLIASIISRVTGKTLREFASERIFDPLGMTSTLFRDDSEQPLTGLADGYAVNQESVRRAGTEECAVGDGGLATNLVDLGHWFGFLEDGRVLGTDLRDLLIDPAAFGSDSPRPYCFGLYHWEIGGEPVFGHSGGVPGYRSHLVVSPKTHLGVAVLSNNSSVDAAELAAAVLGIVADLPAESPSQRVEEPEAAAALDGFWINSATDEPMKITAVDRAGVRLAEGHPSGRFDLTLDGTWHGVGEWAESRISATTDDTMLIESIRRPGAPAAYRRVAPPLADSSLPAGIYRSSELSILAIITDSGQLELGLRMVVPVMPGPGGTFRAGEMLTLRRDGNDLLVSAPGVFRMRFTRQSDGSIPFGVPPSLRDAG
ncbi:serine hydrolase domain-containing protein [Agromyces italicus]|uniref:serine hydrolase domain-containing protein n=1 Tax=Agromyces italicus TaxID=279572 RepID=UPI0003FA64A9|nr:serine hydrolase domain-containing protein [Agromyces italicus]